MAFGISPSNTTTTTTTTTSTTTSTTTTTTNYLFAKLKNKKTLLCSLSFDFIIPCSFLYLALLLRCNLNEGRRRNKNRTRKMRNPADVDFIVNDNCDDDNDDDDDDDDEPPMLVDLGAVAAEEEDDDDDDVPDLTPVEPATSSTTQTIGTVKAGDPTTTTTTTTTTLLPPCPVTILSGFLGSGKTTLIQYILKSPNHGKRIAVIENEFGEGLSVESLIARDGIEKNDDDDDDGGEGGRRSTLQDLIELPNGCVCCTVKDSLVTTLETLIEKRSDLDYIIIEASGMANPGPIAAVFWLDDALESRLQLDGIVTIVDAYHILQQLESTEEAAQQIAYADRLIVNKMDLLLPKKKENNDTSNNDDDTVKEDDGKLKEVELALRQLHPTAPMKLTSFSQVPDLDWILNANCFGGAERLEELDTIWNQAQEAASTNYPRHRHRPGADCYLCQQELDSKKYSSTTQSSSMLPPSSSSPLTTLPSFTTPRRRQQHKHTSMVSTLAFQMKGSVNLSKLNKWLAEILWPNQDETNKVLNAMLQQIPMTLTEQRQEQNDHNNNNNINNNNRSGHFMTSTTTTTKEGRRRRNFSNTMTIFRIKGIVSVRHEVDDLDVIDEMEKRQYIHPTTLLDSRRYIIQAVHDLWDVHAASDGLQWKSSPTSSQDDDNENQDEEIKQDDDDDDEEDKEERIGKLVVIGRHLNEPKLEQGFKSCFYPSSSSS